MKVLRLSDTGRVLYRLLFCMMVLGWCVEAEAQRPERPQGPPTLGLEGGFLSFDTPQFTLKLVKASQTVAGLQPKGTENFDFTPADWLEKRSQDRFVHLGDLDLRLRITFAGEWKSYSTATARKPVLSLPAASSVLAAADLAPTLAEDIPLRVRRFWETDDKDLVLRFELQNKTDQPVEIGALGIPMVFNNILHERTLDQAHTAASFYDPYIGRDAGYLQVTRLSGHGPALLVVPEGQTPFEAYNPIFSDPTDRNITFEGFYEWMAHSGAYAETEWKEAEPWNPPTTVTLAPGEVRSYGVRFLLSPSIQEIEPTLLANGRPVAVGVPGYVLPMDLDARLYLKHNSDVKSIVVEPAGAIEVKPAPATKSGWTSYVVHGKTWGRARLNVTYADGRVQTIHYKVIKPEAQVVDDLGRFLTTEQWFEKPDDPFGRSPSVITYDYEAKRQVTEDVRAWVAGLGDEGGSGAWLAAMMKQLVRPDLQEIARLERFVDGVLWGGLQYTEGDLKYGVRKSMFYYEPDSMAVGTYSDSIRYGGWMSWNKEHAMTVGRSFNYPHVAAAYWVLFRLARCYDGLVKNHPWQWYLQQAYETSEAMVRLAPHYAQFGQMEGTVFVEILNDLKREGMHEQAAALEATMRQRADVWRSLNYPFGSEMPWDSTGQEEVFAWTRYFGYNDKALVTLNAILGYMPTVPHWGYNGSARRYWDFQYAGKLARLERQLHHYGSGINAIPVLTAFRDTPDDLYLLRVGYGGLMGSIANITQEGFGPSAFHAYPSTLRIDGITGDYGPNFFGHAINTGTYVANHPEFGWVAFGGNLAEKDGKVSVKPLDSARSRVYLAALGLWLTLDAGTFDTVTFDPKTGQVDVELSAATPYAPSARLRVEQPARPAGVGTYTIQGTYSREREAYTIPLKKEVTNVTLVANK